MNPALHFFVFTNLDQIPVLDSSKSLIVKIDSTSMNTMNKLYIQLNQELQFGGDFGKNLDALFDCMSDLSWIKKSQFQIIFTNTEDFLIDESDTKIIDLLDTLNDVADSINDEPIISNQNRTMKFYFQESDRMVMLLDESYQEWEYLD